MRSQFSQGWPNFQVLARDVAIHYDQLGNRVMFSQQDRVFNLDVEVKRPTDSAAGPD